MRVFGTYYGRRYEAMAKVWMNSLARHCPTAKVEVDTSCPRPVRIGGYRPSNHLIGNTHKLKLWVDAVEKAFEAGENIVLMDTDTFVIGDLEPAFNDTFDVAYTVRQYKVPFNCGVIFVQPTEKALAFMRRWLSENSRLFSNRRQANHAARVYGGVNQGAFALIKNKPDCKLKTLPCSIWNAEQESWKDFDPEKTRVIHVKSDLRSRINIGRQGDPNGDIVDRLVFLYRQYEESAVSA